MSLKILTKIKTETEQKLEEIQREMENITNPNQKKLYLDKIEHIRFGLICINSKINIEQIKNESFS